MNAPVRGSHESGEMKMANREKIVLTIEQVPSGYYIDCRDLPELNLFISSFEKILTAVPEAIKYLYKHNRGMDVRVLMEVPVFSDAAVKSEKYVELEPLQLAA